MQPIDVSQKEIITYQDALIGLIEAREQRDICSNKIDGLKEWYDSTFKINEEEFNNGRP